MEAAGWGNDVKVLLETIRKPTRGLKPDLWWGDEHLELWPPNTPKLRLEQNISNSTELKSAMVLKARANLILRL